MSGISVCHRISLSRLVLFACVFTSLGLCLASLSAAKPGPEPAEPPGFAPGQLLVLLEAGSAAPTPEAVIERFRQGQALEGALGAGRPVAVRHLISRRATGAAAAALEAEPDSPRAMLRRYLVLDYPEGTDLEQILEVLLEDPSVRHAHRSRVFTLSLPPVQPNDPFFPVMATPQDYQWGLHALNLPEAWALNKGHAYVGVLDTGLDTDHPDLLAFDSAGTYLGGNFREHFSHDFGDMPRDDDVDEMEGSNLPFAGHGTHVSGIIAANTNNDDGVAGVCWSCSLLMEKITDENKQFAFEPEVVDAFDRALDHGAQVISMSFGHLQPANCSTSTVDAFCLQLEEAEAREVASFAAAGNFLDDLQFPASDERVISVGGLEPSLNFWDFRDGDPRGCPFSGLGECGSNWTQTANVAMQDFVAPAVDVLSTFYVGADWNRGVGCVDNPDDETPDAHPGYGLCTGTSMAAPHGAGLGGLLRSIQPLLGKEDIRSAINDHASRAGSWDPQLGYGIPDAAASVEAILGQAGGVAIENRLTPLFQLFSSIAGDYAYTTVPQVASAWTWADEAYISPFGSAPRVRGYGPFFPGGRTCPVGPCNYEPRADVYLFTGDRSPNGHPLVPLYRMSFDEPFGGNPDDRDHTYTTEKAGLEAFYDVGYRLDGIEGYLYERCSPEPSCIPEGAVRLYRMYKASIDDWAIFPESKRDAFLADGYLPQSCCNEWIGYVYENVDSDLDLLVDGFEGLIGTDPAVLDSDCDGLADGLELPPAGLPVGDPLDGPCAPSDFGILDTFAGGGGGLDGRQTEVGEVTWNARPGAWVAGGRVNDAEAIGFVPFEASALPAGTILELSVDVGISSSEWAAVGFSGANRPFLVAGQLWVQLFGNGSYQVRGRNQILGQGSIPGGPAGVHHVDIRYGTGDRRATVWINGAQVLSQVLGSAPNLRFAGFQMFRTVEYGGEIDNFEILDVTTQRSVLIADSFTGNGGLDGRTTEVGNAVWRGTDGAVLEFNRVFDSAAIGGVPLAGPGVEELPLVVGADVTPSGKGWVGIGFTREPDAPLWQSSELWSLVYPSGFYVVYAHGNRVASGARPAGLVYHPEVAFDPGTRRATVTIDGQVVYTQVLSSQPARPFAGFQVFGGEGFLDNFEVGTFQP